MYSNATTECTFIVLDKALPGAEAFMTTGPCVPCFLPPSTEHIQQPI